MIRIEQDTNTAYMVAEGKLNDEDYDRMISCLKGMMEQHEKVNWYFRMKDFEGWSTHAFWRDISFTLSNRLAFNKVAIVGENKWQEAMVEVMELFSAVRINYFDEEEAEKAWKWVGAEKD